MNKLYIEKEKIPTYIFWTMKCLFLLYIIYKNYMSDAFNLVNPQRISSITGGVIDITFIPRNIILLAEIIFLSIIDLIGYILLKGIKVRYKMLCFFYVCSPIWNYELYIKNNYALAFSVILLICSVKCFGQRFGKKEYLFGTICTVAACIVNPFVSFFVPIIGFYVFRRGDKKYCWVICFLTVMLFFVLFCKEVYSIMVTYLDLSHTYGMVYILVCFLVIYFYANLINIYHFSTELLILFVLIASILLTVYVPENATGYTMFTIFCVYFSKYACFKRLPVLFFAVLENILRLVTLLSNNRDNKILLIIFCSVQFFICFYFLKICETNSLYRYSSDPFIIGISGDSGSGKSSLLNLIDCTLDDRENKVFIEGDGDHRWNRFDKHWEEFTALNPEANYLYRQAYNIIGLKQHAIQCRRDYDHATGMFTQTYKIKGGKYILLSGLHALYLPILRDSLDLKIFLDTDDNLKKNWKIKRDINERGYSIDEIISQIEKRKCDVEKYIYPQRQYADLTITYFDRSLNDYTDINHKEILSVKITLSMENNMEYLLNELISNGVELYTDISADLNWQTVTIIGDSVLEKEIDLESIAKKTVPFYEDLFTFKPNWVKGIEGIVQLFLIVAIDKRLRKGI